MASRDEINDELQAFELLWLEAAKRMTIDELAAFGRDMTSALQSGAFPTGSPAAAHRAQVIVSETLRYRSTADLRG